MKNKHYIKTLEDIKYCEEHQIVVWNTSDKDCYYNFDGNIWSFYRKGKLVVYNTDVFVNSGLYYNEEESEEQQEASEKGIGKLCWFGDRKKEKVIGILEKVDLNDKEPYKKVEGFWYKHCRRLTPSEVAEITGYGVTEEGSTFYGEPFKVVGKEK